VIALRIIGVAMKVIKRHVSVWLSSAMFILFGCRVMAQNPEGGMTRLGFEVGVSYEGEPIATEKTVCNPDEWSRSIDWGDNTPKEALKSSATKTFGDGTAVPAGTYVIFAGKHQYNTAQKYSGTLYISQHCRNILPGTPEFSFPFTVQVFARVPINSVQGPATAIRRGSKAKLTIILEALAPLSNTRVFLEADKAVFSNIPQFSDVPENGNVTTVSLSVRPNAPAGDSEVKFWTDPDPAAKKPVSVTIAP
jgi:hypothetical protein